MRISTRTRYGLRAMVCLAQSYGAGPLSVRDIAEAHQLPVKYLERLCGTLKRARLIAAVRGAAGGYVLARPPEQIQLFDIYQALEGSVAPVHCVEPGDTCHQRGTCPTHRVWKSLAGALQGALEEQTLADLAGEPELD